MNICPFHQEHGLVVIGWKVMPLQNSLPFRGLNGCQLELALSIKPDQKTCPNRTQLADPIKKDDPITGGHTWCDLRLLIHKLTKVHMQ